ncbi:hypothetical protein ElyMa_000149100, partial [Elysia marginata]
GGRVYLLDGWCRVPVYFEFCSQTSSCDEDRRPPSDSMIQLQLYSYNVICKESAEPQAVLIVDEWEDLDQTPAWTFDDALDVSNIETIRENLRTCHLPKMNKKADTDEKTITCDHSSELSCLLDLMSPEEQLNNSSGTATMPTDTVSSRDVFQQPRVRINNLLISDSQKLLLDQVSLSAPTKKDRSKKPVVKLSDLVISESQKLVLEELSEWKTTTKAEKFGASDSLFSDTDPELNFSSSRTSRKESNAQKRISDFGSCKSTDECNAQKQISDFGSSKSTDECNKQISDTEDLQSQPVCFDEDVPDVNTDDPQCANVSSDDDIYILNPYGKEKSKIYFREMLKNLKTDLQDQSERFSEDQFSQYWNLLSSCSSEPSQDTCNNLTTPPEKTSSVDSKFDLIKDGEGCASVKGESKAKSQLTLEIKDEVTSYCFPSWTSRDQDLEEIKPAQSELETAYLKSTLPVNDTETKKGKCMSYKESGIYSQELLCKFEVQEKVDSEITDIDKVIWDPGIEIKEQGLSTFGADVPANLGNTSEDISDEAKYYRSSPADDCTLVGQQSVRVRGKADGNMSKPGDRVHRQALNMASKGGNRNTLGPIKSSRDGKIAERVKLDGRQDRQSGIEGNRDWLEETSNYERKNFLAALRLNSSNEVSLNRLNFSRDKEIKHHGKLQLSDSRHDTKAEHLTKTTSSITTAISTKSAHSFSNTKSILSTATYSTSACSMCTNSTGANSTPTIRTSISRTDMNGKTANNTCIISTSSNNASTKSTYACSSSMNITSVYNASLCSTAINITNNYDQSAYNSFNCCKFTRNVSPYCPTTCMRKQQKRKSSSEDSLGLSQYNLRKRRKKFLSAQSAQTYDQSCCTDEANWCRGLKPHVTIREVCREDPYVAKILIKSEGLMSFPDPVEPRKCSFALNLSSCTDGVRSMAWEKNASTYKLKERKMRISGGKKNTKPCYLTGHSSKNNCEKSSSLKGSVAVYQQRQGNESDKSDQICSVEDSFQSSPDAPGFFAWPFSEGVVKHYPNRVLSHHTNHSNTEAHVMFLSNKSNNCPFKGSQGDKLHQPSHCLSSGMISPDIESQESEHFSDFTRQTSKRGLICIPPTPVESQGFEPQCLDFDEELEAASLEFTGMKSFSPQAAVHVEHAPQTQDFSGVDRILHFVHYGKT